MVIAIVVLVLVLCLVVGYAAGQREILFESQRSVEELTAQNLELHDQNLELRDQNRAHEFNLEMLLREVDKS